MIEPQLYRDAMARFAGAVHVVTTDGVAGKRGVTVIAACSVSDEPPTILVCLNRHNSSNELFLQNGVFALNTLSADSIEVSNAFSGFSGLDSKDRFSVGDWGKLVTGAPVLKNALAVFDCTLIEAKEMATHRIYIGRVTGIQIGQNPQPLLYYNRGYRVLHD